MVSTAILGSCVSRDTLDLGGVDAFDLKAYVARQSLISTENDSRSWFPADLQLASRFQRSMVESDLRGTGLRQIERAANDVDLVILDLTDERHGCVRFPDGSIATRGVEVLASDTLRESLGRGQLIAFGTTEHLAIWTSAAERTLDALDSCGLLKRTVLIALPWATAAMDGTPTPPSMGLEAEDANRKYRPYFEHLVSCGVHAITVPNPLADQMHRWGFAPFHYEPTVYRQIARELCDSV